MALIVRNIKVPLNISDQEWSSFLLQESTQRLGIPSAEIKSCSIYKKSLDARKKTDIHYNVQVIIDTDLDRKIEQQFLPDCQFIEFKDPSEEFSKIVPRMDYFELPPIIVGSGPSGVFAALEFARKGIPCIVLERGEAVEQRIRSVHSLLRDGNFSPESNYCYGEGGAGTFSDGKLSCGRNHPLIRYLFQVWHEFGAPESILYDAHPHIGTDYLLKVSMNMRKYLESCGTRFLFNSKMTNLLRMDHKGRSLFEVVLQDGSRLQSRHVLLAVGHSARETYRMLLDRGVAMQQKPFAMGVRIEHPQEVIDRIQFGHCERLPAAEYKLTSQVQDRGIWTFCMCPGGHLLPTGAQEGHLAINGMSYYARGSGFANAAVVVNVNREDYDRGHVLDGVRFQENLEQQAFRLGGGAYHSPAQRLVDFMKERDSQGDLKSTYKPGVRAARLDKLLPTFVKRSLQKAMGDYDQKMRGYIHPQSIVCGVETKTSAPIMMPRDPKRFYSVSYPGLYPLGEGAGYAGGIVSAALDGVRVGRSIIADSDGRI